MPDINEVELRFIDNAEASQGRVKALYNQVETGGRSAGAVVDQLSSQFARVPGPIGQAANAVQSLGTVSMGGVAAVGALAGGLIGIGMAAKDAAEGFLDYTTKMMRLSDQTGMSVDFVARFAQAADDASLASRGIGVEVETVSGALQRFTLQVGRGIDENGKFTTAGGRVVSALKAMGVSSDEVSAVLDKPEELLLLIADAVSKVENPSQRGAAAFALFGQAGRDLLPLLSQGRDGVKQMMVAIEGSLAPTEAATKAASDYKLALDGLEDSVAAIKQALGGGIVAALAPAAKSTADYMTSTRAANLAVADAARELQAYGRITDETAQKILAMGNAQARTALWSTSSIDPQQNQARVMLLDMIDLRQRLNEQTIMSYRSESEWAAVATSAQGEQARVLGELNTKTQENTWREYGEDVQTVADKMFAWQTEGENAKTKLKQIGDEAAIAKGKIDDLRGAFNKEWKPPTKGEQAQNVLGLATGAVTVQKFEDDQMGSMLGTLAGKGVLKADQVGAIGQSVKNFGFNSAETFKLIAQTSPAAQSALAQFAKTLRDTETAAGVGLGQIGDMGKFVTTGTRTVQPGAGTQLSAREAALEADRAKAALDKAQFSEPLLPQMYPNEWTPDKAKANTEAAAIAYEKSVARMDAAARAAQPSLQTTYGFAKPFFEFQGAGIDKYDAGGMGTANNPEAGPGKTGADLAGGIGQGFATQAEPLKNEMITAIDTALEGVRIRYRMQSPSGYTSDEIGKPLGEGVAMGMTESIVFVRTATMTLIADNITMMTSTETKGLWYGAGESWAFAVADGITAGQKRIEKAFQDAVKGAMGFLIIEMVDEIRRRLR